MSSSTLISRFGKEIPLHRFLAGSRVVGEWVDGAEEFLAVASQVQAMTFSGLPDAGVLTLEFDGEIFGAIALQGDLEEVGNLQALVDAIQAEMDVLPTIGLDDNDDPNCEASGAVNINEDGSKFLSLGFEFMRDLGDQPLPHITISASTMTEEGVDVYLVSDTLVTEGVAPNTPHTIMASAQPMSGRVRMLLPEGQRTREGMEVYTTSEVFTARELDLKKADRVEWEGRTFEVVMVENWTAEKDLPHYLAAVLLVEEDVA